MKKQFLSLVLVVSMMMCFAVVTVSAKEWIYVSGNTILRIEESNGECTVIASGKDAITIDIPSTVGGCPVTGIRDKAFHACIFLSSINIPDSVTTIGDQAFYNCSRLSSINVSENNEFYSSEDGVLFNKNKTELICCPCMKEGSYIIPNNVTTICDDAFDNCYYLSSINIPDSVTTIGDKAFYDCYELSSINVGENNEFYSSEDGVLFNKNKTELICCPGMKEGSCIIPDSVTTIGDGAFYGCCALSSINIPDSVTSIGFSAFEWCSSLTSIIIPDSVTSICNNVFYGCSSLTSVTIPDSVTSIGDGAFYGCNSLASITIPNSVTSIGNNAFYYVPSTCVAYILKGFDKSMMTNAKYTGTFVELSPTEVSDGAAYSSKNNDSAIMRFMWKVNFDEKQPISKLGAYIIPWDDFTDITTDERAVNIQYVSPKTTEGQDMQSGNTFAVDVINIPSAKYDTSFYAVPFVNNTFFENQMINSTVNKADINKED